MESRSVISSVLQAVLLFIHPSLLSAFCRRHVGLQVEFDFKSTNTLLKNCCLNKLFCICAVDYSSVCVCVYYVFADTPVWVCPLKKHHESESL